MFSTLLAQMGLETISAVKLGAIRCCFTNRSRCTYIKIMTFTTLFYLLGMSLVQSMFPLRPCPHRH